MYVIFLIRNMKCLITWTGFASNRNIIPLKRKTYFGIKFIKFRYFNIFKFRYFNMFKFRYFSKFHFDGAYHDIEYGRSATP